MDPLKEKESDHLRLGLQGSHKKAVIITSVSANDREGGVPAKTVGDKPFAAAALFIVKWGRECGQATLLDQHPSLSAASTACNRAFRSLSPLISFSFSSSLASISSPRLVFAHFARSPFVL
jgi:hypothetical protein